MSAIFRYPLFSDKTDYRFPKHKYPLFFTRETIDQVEKNKARSTRNKIILTTTLVLFGLGILGSCRDCHGASLNPDYLGDIGDRPPIYKSLK